MNAWLFLISKKMLATWRRHWSRRRAGRLRLVEALGLGDRRTAGILEVEGRRFLIGTTAHAVTLLAELAGNRSGAGAAVAHRGDPAIPQPPPEAVPNPGPGPPPGPSPNRESVA